MTAKSRILAAALVAAALLVAQPSTDGTRGPLPEEWVAHLQNDLLPFYSVPAALGDPIGEFPSTRCDDGSLLDFKKPCAPIAGNSYLMTPNWYLVPMSRQVYGYGVAFHMTGDPRYLAVMKLGVDTIRRRFIDRASGGMYLQMDLNTKQWGPDAAFRDPQQLGYGLLGLSFYYYLTRDSAVLADIMTIQRYIWSKYWNPTLGSMQWLLRSNGSTAFDQLQLTACLDQMNTYLVLLTPIVPEPYRGELREEMRTLVRAMISVFYNPAANLYFTSATRPADTDLQRTGTDNGHTGKALWMSRFEGLMDGDPNLVAWAEASARRHLARSWIDSDGSWAAGVVAGGALDRNKNWWVYSELDQLAGTLAIEDPAAAANLARSARYWFTYFVDKQYGDVWNGVDFGTNAPQKSYPKAWQWKSAYHAFEHALVGYIAGSRLHGTPLVLYYAFAADTPAEAVSPYYLRGRLERVEALGEGVRKVTLSGEPVAAPTSRALSAASFLPAPLAPLSFGTVMGEGLAGAAVTLTDSSGAVRPARVVGSTAGQVNFLVPAGLAPGPASVNVTRAAPAPSASPWPLFEAGLCDLTQSLGCLLGLERGLTQPVQRIEKFPLLEFSHADSSSGQNIEPEMRAATIIAPVSPSVFQLDASALAAANVIRVRADGTQTVEAIGQGISFGAASDQVYLTIYATGIRNAKDVKVLIRGREVPVLYAGPQGIDGLDQINVGPLPRSLSGRGRVSILVLADGLTGNAVQAEFL